MVVMVVTAGPDVPDAEPLLSVLGAGRTAEVLWTSDTDLDTTLTDDLVAALAAVVVLTGAEAEAGHRVCRGVRTASASIPLCLVSTSTREVDELMAFANGCDDYIGMPCSPPVLRARLAALVARGRDRAERVMTFGCLRVDPRLRTATVRGEPVDLTRTEFDLMTVLVANQRRVVPRHELLDRVWGGCQTHEHVLDVHMSRMRSKVLAAGGPKLGDAVPGVGYRVGHRTCPPGDCRPYGAA
jgi:DNA-binding response OmpR family regulator